MINNINIQRSGMKNPLLCQDSLLTSLAQQHANDMAATDLLDHNLPCTSTAFPVQFCSASTRLAPYGESSENIVALTGNSGSASSAMAQFNADAGQFSNMMNPDYLYVGVGMAMNPVSGKYYWVQVFSSGNYQGVSCSLQPVVTILDAYNRTRVTVQPIKGLNLKVYPQGITDKKKTGLYCTMVPHLQASGTSKVSLGQLPYPTITMVPYNSANAMKSQISGIIGAFAAALSQANATIVGPSSLKMVPMQVSPTDSSETLTVPSPITTTAVDPESILAAFSPTDSAQSSAALAMSSMMADPSMSSAAAQMAQFMAMATPTSTLTSSSITLASSTSTISSTSSSSTITTSTTIYDLF
jgi:hypothetical protein